MVFVRVLARSALAAPRAAPPVARQCERRPLDVLDEACMTIAKARFTGSADEEKKLTVRNLFIEPTEEELQTMNLPFPSFPNKDGWLSSLFLYLAFHGKREQAQANTNAEEQYAFGEDPTLLEHLEMGEELTMRLDDDDS